jgi:RNA polymerase sigma-70 factor (ECF subfamily)
LPVKEPALSEHCLHDVPNEAVDVSVASGLEVLFREEAPRLWRSIVLFTGSPEIASDAVAEAFAQALRHGSGIRDPLAWIWRVALRTADREVRNRGQLRPVPPDAAYEMPEPVVDLVQALAELSVHQRTAVVLADYAGYPHRQIAKILDSTPSAVGVHVYRGRRRLRELLGDRDA